MSSRTRLQHEVTEIVAEIAEVSPDEISAEARLEDLGIDSLDGLRIVAAVEQKYGIVIDEIEIARIGTMPDIFRLVEKHAQEVE